MPKRKETLFDAIVAKPWPQGIAAGIFFYVVIRYVLAGLFVSTGNVFLKAMGEQLAHGGVASLSSIALIVCWIGAALSFLRGHHRGQLLETQSGLKSLERMSWREFEMLVGEAFRRRGYAVEETGLGGADGGVDLILRKGRLTELVQCKQWRTRHIKVNVVREMAGLLAHHRADAVKIVCLGVFTRDAQAFAQGKPIELINGEKLLQLVRDVQVDASSASHASSPAAASVSTSEPTCPACGALMVRRVARDSQKAFWGCGTYPKCRGSRSIS